MNGVKTMGRSILGALVLILLAGSARAQVPSSVWIELTPPEQQALLKAVDLGIKEGGLNAIGSLLPIANKVFDAIQKQKDAAALNAAKAEDAKRAEQADKAKEQPK